MICFAAVASSKPCCELCRAGTLAQERRFELMIEREGRFKFVSYTNKL